MKERLGQVKVGSLGLLPDVPFNVKVLIDAGIVRPTRPDRLAGVLRELRRWGASPAAGAAAAAIRYPNETMIIDELGELTFAEVHERSNKLANALRRAGDLRGRRRRHPRPQPPRLRRDGLGRLEARCERALHEHDVLRPAARRRPRARGSQGRRLRRGVPRRHGEGGRRAQALRGVVSGGRSARRPHDRVADRGDRRFLRSRPAREVVQVHRPHLGHDRDAEGRAARPARHARPDRGAPVEDPAEGARDDDDRRAALPLLGLRALLDRALALLDLRPAPQVRPRGDAQGHRGEQGLGPDRRAGDDAAHPPARRRGDREVRPLLAQGHLRLGLGPSRRARHRVDGRDRRQPLQPLRLDRGRVGDDRDPGRPARRAGTAGRIPHGTRSRSTTRTRRSCPRARPGGSSSATR